MYIGLCHWCQFNSNFKQTNKFPKGLDESRPYSLFIAQRTDSRIQICTVFFQIWEPSYMFQASVPDSVDDPDELLSSQRRNEVPWGLPQLPCEALPHGRGRHGGHKDRGRAAFYVQQQLRWVNDPVAQGQSFQTIKEVLRSNLGRCPDCFLSNR